MAKDAVSAPKVPDCNNLTSLTELTGADELTDGRWTIRQRVAVGIDPQEWAEYAALGATMDPSLFSCVREHVLLLHREWSRYQDACR